jgi:hypothetical protein
MVPEDFRLPLQISQACRITGWAQRVGFSIAGVRQYQGQPLTVYLGEANPGDEDAYTSALAQLSSILPYGELYKGMKMEFSANEMKCRYVSNAGKMVTTRLTVRKGILYEWVE